MFVFADTLIDQVKDTAATAVYISVLRNLLLFNKKLAKNYGPVRTEISELVLHGTESLGTQDASSTYLQSVAGIHYFIGRDNGLAYLIVPDEYQAFHAGNPKGHSNVQDHNPKSIGIEMYQQDISIFKNDSSKLDFTDWQYETVSMLSYHVCHRWSIPRASIVGHGDVNPVDRSPDEPRKFDWDRFNRNLDSLSTTMVNLLGADYALPQ